MRRFICILVLALFLFINAASSGYDQPAVDEFQKQKILNKVATELISVAREQYNRGLYCHSEEYLIRAEKYSEYLSADQLAEAKELLDKVHGLAVKRSEVFKVIDLAEGNIQKGELSEARGKLASAVGSKYLLPQENEKLVQKLSGVDAQIKQREENFTQIFSTSVSLYKKGQADESKAGFEQIARDESFTDEQKRKAVYYLESIEKKMSVTDNLTIEEFVLIETTAEPGEVSEIEQVALPAEASREVALSKKQKLLRDYAKAVVEDAIGAVEQGIKDGQFFRTKEKIEKAQGFLMQNRDQLGQAAFDEYKEKLELMSEEIEKGRQRWLGNWKDNGAWKL
ncbi:MAG: hypothetical protein ISS77_03915 [Phycisphaerae bacterium]|nr:hypothetical protein [Phycisphaerae bacterium]